MSTSSPVNRETFQLTAQAEPGTLIEIFDGYGERKGSGESELSLRLPRGIYRIVGELGGLTQEYIHWLQEDVQLGGMGPMVYSAAPLAGAETSHEFYTEPSERLSRQSTGADLGGADGKLFVFVRALDQVVYQNSGADLAAGLALLDESRELVSRFAPDDTEADGAYGWLALSAGARRGTYYLRYENGADSREVPIHVAQGWQTQVFLMHHGRPLFEGMRVFMGWPSAGFVADDETARAVDAALLGLQNGAERIARKAMKIVLEGKFENPMLGVLGAHFLLRRQEIPEDLLRTVMGNLMNLAPDLPDVRVLDVLASNALDEALPDVVVDAPPMVRAGLERLLELAVDHPQLVREDGVVERIASRLYSDSPWTSWDPLERADMAAEPNWVQLEVLSAFEDSLARKQPFDPSRVAVDLGLPKRVIGSALVGLGEVRGLGSESPVELTRAVEEFGNVTAMAHSLVERFR